MHGVAVARSSACCRPSAAIIVPMPASVKISSSSTWGMRPSRMWARPTPSRTACDAAVDLRDHPAGDQCRRPSALELVGASSGGSGWRVVDVAAQALDVGEVDELLGAERLGDAPATVSALMLYAWPGASAPIVATTGMKSSSSRRSRIAGLTGSTSPTKPERRGRGPSAPIRPASSPPTADGERAVDVDRRHDLRVDLADQHHAGDVEGLGVGDPQAVAELRHLAEAGHQVADLRAAAVHDDGPHARPSASARCPAANSGERVVAVGAGEGVAAVLDDDDLARRSGGCTAAPRRGRRPSRPVAAGRRLGLDGGQRSRRAHVLVDVRVGQVVGEHDGRARRRGRGRR